VKKRASWATDVFGADRGGEPDGATVVVVVVVVAAEPIGAAPLQAAHPTTTAKATATVATEPATA